MERTYANFSTLCKKSKNIASLHKIQNNKLETIASDWPFHSWADMISAGGSICANVDDVLAWLNLQLGYKAEKILPHEIICDLHKPVIMQRMINCCY